MISARFLRRISAYPQHVQDMLQQEVTDTLMADTLRVMHGPHAKTAPAPSPVILLDTLLSRLVVSKRFLGNADRLIRLVRSADHRAALDAMIDEFLTPIADPDAPYLYKIREVAGAEGDPDIRATLGALVALCTEFTAYRIAGADRIPFPDLLSAAILSAGNTAETGFLNRLLLAAGWAIRFANPSGEPVTDARDGARTGLLRHLLGARPRAELAGPDRIALQTIAEVRMQDHAPVLGPDRGLRLTLTDTPTEDDRRFWDRVPAAGDASAPVLSIAPAQRMSDIALAFLACVRPPDDGAIRIFGKDIAHDARAWGNFVTGYRDLGPDRREVGRFGTDAAQGAAVDMILSATLRDTDMAGGDDLETCYAILLRLDAGVDPSRYINAGCCAVFDSADALMAALARANRRVRRKPVVVLGRRTPTDADYLVRAVPEYWAHGGNHPISCTSLHFDGMTGVFSVTVPTGIDLCQMTATDTTVMPASWMLEAGADVARALETGLVVVDDGVAVSRRWGIVIDDDICPRLTHALNTARLTLEERERVFLTGTTDHVWLSRRNKPSNWAVERAIAQRLDHHRTLASRLAAFGAKPEAATAADIFARLEGRPAASAGLAEQLDPFAVALSCNPAVVLDLTNDHVLHLIELARHTAGADAIARNLAACADRICAKGIDLIVPLFEFLACCLPRPALMAALSFSALADDDPPYVLRVAEVLRRYADPSTMILFLGHVQRRAPSLLDDAALLRCVQRVPASAQSAVARTLVGPEVMDRIAATVDFRDRFRMAVLDGDTAEMRRLASDPHGMRQVNFTRWMDDLRGLSNELRALDLDGFVVPGIDGLHRRKLAAVTFGDRTTLDEFRRNGFLDADIDIDAIAHNVLGDNASLNRMIAARSEGTGIPPVRIEGTTAAEVFAHARATLEVPPVREDGPLVSVVMSAFNPDLDLLRLSVQSILDQTHANVEIFVVDDASAVDSSGAMADMLARLPKVRYLRVAANSGPYVGRNLALAQAKGDFVAIQDADDWSHPCRFAAQIAAFAAMPALRLVTTPHIRIDRAGCVQMEANFTIFGDGPMTSMFRRAVFDDIGPFADVRSRGDVEMRERLHAYYGPQAMTELAAPAMLCFADSATLSQRTKSGSAEYLQLFRTNIDRRRSFANLRRDGIPLGPDHRIIVPLALRPVQEGGAP